MLLDSQLTLDLNSSLAIAAGSQASANTLDWAGVGAGTAPPNYFGVQNAVFGQDIGIGDGESPPVLVCIVGTTFASLGAATLNVALQAAVDSGSPTYQPGAWDTIAETSALPLASLTAGTKIAEFTIPPRQPGQAFPRFFRLNYTVGTATMTAGTIAYAGIATGRDDAPIYPANY
jgi:hypothetical protein